MEYLHINCSHSHNQYDSAIPVHALQLPDSARFFHPKQNMFLSYKNGFRLHFFLLPVIPSGFSSGEYPSAFPMEVSFLHTRSADNIIAVLTHFLSFSDQKNQPERCRPVSFFLLLHHFSDSVKKLLPKSALHSHFLLLLHDHDPAQLFLLLSHYHFPAVPAHKI